MSFKRVGELSRLANCSVIEGNLVISGILDQDHDENSPKFNMSFPELREITDYLLVYASKGMPSMTDLFPNLSVIRGNQLLEVNY